MESYLAASHFDLVSPDGYIHSITFIDKKHAEAYVKIKNISPVFAGYDIDESMIHFNLKSVLAQVGIDGTKKELCLNRKHGCAEITVQLTALCPLGEEMLSLLGRNCYLGKLFVADERRKVRDPIYLKRLLGRTDQEGRPLLFLGSPQGKGELALEKIEGYTVAFIPLKEGCLYYDSFIKSFLPTLAKALKQKDLPLRAFLHLHHKWNAKHPCVVKENDILLARTSPLHIRTVFAKVVDRLLPPGYSHTSANILQPDTMASGDIYELYGSSDMALKEIPLEFYTLEPHREYVFFSDRDQLQAALENTQILFTAFKDSPEPKDNSASVFIVKERQLKNLSKRDWISREIYRHELPGLGHPIRQSYLLDKCIEQQSSYPFLKAIEENLITSQGVLLTRYFPSPLLKRMLISDAVLRCLKGIYFQHPSHSSGYFFSHEDRSLLLDLARFGIPVFWVDDISGKILQYTVKPDKDSGMFVPVHLVEDFKKATFFGVYGSHFLEGNLETELKKLLKGVLDMKHLMSHPLLNPQTPLALVTGGGSGAMEIGNKVAKDLGILSCANIVDFSKKGGSLTEEQNQNLFVDAKMTYRLDRLVERQAEFHLDFPICILGGIGTDFEFALEEVRRKVGAFPAYPILLFGEESYWKRKITSLFQCNAENKTIKGVEWISNCFYCIQTAEQGLKIYSDFFKGNLNAGPTGPIYPDGFCTVPPV